MGSIYDDFATIRSISIAKVRSNKLVLAKNKYEFTVICPGEISNQANDETKTFVGDPKIALAMNVLTNQIKGNTEITQIR